jgi:hypothetical protein
MKTEDWVSLLATGVEPIDAKRTARRQLLAIIGGLLGALALTAGILRLNPALSHAVVEPMFWIREAYCAALALLGFAAVTRLARPGTRLGLGKTAVVCPFLITLVAAPLFFSFLWVLRELAPTRLRLAGAAAGFAAGSLGALVYSLHCPELAAPFLGTWYLIGMLIPTALGAWLAPRLVRW